MQPAIPNSVVEERCNRLCSYAKANNIKYAVAVDGKHHPMKAAENNAREDDRNKARSELDELFSTNDINSILASNDEKLKEALKLMKRSVRVTPDVIATAVRIFRENGHDVYGAPFEADWQLVHWEQTGFTEGTISIDSDIWAMGSKVFVDLLNYNSSDGKCVVLEREKVKGNVMEGSDQWEVKHFLLYSALCGCDFIKRLFRLEQKKIEEVMKRYTDPSNTVVLDQLLTELSAGRHWPGGNNKPGELATNFVDKVHACIGLMTHAPVFDYRDDILQIVPMVPLPEGMEWSDVIGFDPIEIFSDTPLEGSYKVDTLARFDEPLPPPLPLPRHPNDPSREVPHAAVVNYDCMPPIVTPAAVQRMWLYYHDNPHPKGASRKALSEQVMRGLSLGLELDEDNIKETEATTSNSYISIDGIKVLSPVEWSTDGDEAVRAVRHDKTPTINTAYIESVFGVGKNGIRDRAWLRFVSGHMNVETLRVATCRVDVDGKEEMARIFEMKVTPSMKNVVYSVYLVFSMDGKFLNKLSRCDCPNGWLFCSHTLACFLLFYLIQQKVDWSFSDIVDAMPVPIKSLQSVPFAASFVFGKLRVSKPGRKGGKIGKGQDAYSKKLAKSIAKDIPGYSGKYAINDEDAVAETELLNNELTQKSKDVKSTDLCKRVDEWVGMKGVSDNSTTNNDAKVSMETINTYNQALVENEEAPKVVLQKYIRHERLYQMMRSGKISTNNTMFGYLDHFAAHRKEQIEKLSDEVAASDRVGPSTTEYSVNFLQKYFEDDDDN